MGPVKKEEICCFRFFFAARVRCTSGILLHKPLCNARCLSLFSGACITRARLGCSNSFHISSMQCLKLYSFPFLTPHVSFLFVLLFFFFSFISKDTFSSNLWSSISSLIDFFLICKFYQFIELVIFFSLRLILTIFWKSHN